MSKVADLEVKLKDTNDRLLECGQNSSSLDNSRLSDSRFTGSALEKSAVLTATKPSLLDGGLEWTLESVR